MKRDDLLRLLYGLTMVLAGLVGLALVLFVFLALAGISTPVSWLYVVVYFGAAMLGPLLLVAGGALFALRLKPRLAAMVALAGASVVTIWTAGILGSALLNAARPSANPAIDNTIHLRDSAIYGILAVAAAAIDWVGYRALRLAR